MEITWYGHSCFRLAERGRATIATDPFDDSLGYEVPRIKADIVTVSHEAPGHNYVYAARGAREIRGPGEYEIGGVFITGIATNRPEAGGRKRKENGKSGRNTLYLFDFDGVTVCHLGDLNHVPTQTQIENLGTVGIALVPVGGGGGLNAAQAAEVISLIEPSIVVPMHYRTASTTVKLDPLSKFLKEMGLGNLKAQDALKVTKSQLPDETQVVVLSYKGEEAGSE
jgi:L-ascorbate metabolism protein UlaG (beta-lactamase superfamily)